MKEFGIQTGNYILSVSRLVGHKGVHTIIEAYKELKKYLPNAPQLVIVGGPSYTLQYVDFLKNQATGDPDIIFTGELFGSVLGELYSNASVFVQASEDEGVSIALLEALSYGCRVLVSDIAGNREIVSCQRCMFQSKNAPDLADKLRAILTFEHTAQLCTQEYQLRVRTVYNVDTTSKRVSYVYGDLSHQSAA